MFGATEPQQQGRIERVDLSTGRVERLYEACDGIALSGPNDIVFDASGGFWFTDLGQVRDGVHAFGGLFYAQPDGSAITRVYRGPLLLQWRGPLA